MRPVRPRPPSSCPTAPSSPARPLPCSAPRPQPCSPHLRRSPVCRTTCSVLPQLIIEPIQKLEGRGSRQPQPPPAHRRGAHRAVHLGGDQPGRGARARAAAQTFRLRGPFLRHARAGRYRRFQKARHEPHLRAALPDQKALSQVNPGASRFSAARLFLSQKFNFYPLSPCIPHRIML